MTVPMLFGPAPSPVSRAVLDAQAREVVDPTAQPFSELFTDVALMVGELCAAPDHQVIIQTGTATAALEGALLNLTSAGDRVVAVVNGQLSARLAAVAESVGLEVCRLDLPWGSTPDDPAAIRALVDERTTVVLAVHCETSTGAVLDPRVLASGVRGLPAMVVLDVVASIGAIPVHTAQWGIDVVVGSSQKGLGGTPGLGVSVVSRRAMRRVRAKGARTFALDWCRFAEGFVKNRPGSVFTPAVSLVSGLAVALRQLMVEVPEVRAKRFAQLRSHLVAALIARGFETVASAGHEISPVVVVRPPALCPADDIAGELIRLGVSVGVGQGAWRGQVLRFGLFGQSMETVAQLATAIDTAVGAITARDKRNR